MTNTLIVFALHRLEQQTHTQKQDQQNERLMKNVPIVLGTTPYELLRLFSEVKRAPENSEIIMITSCKTDMIIGSSKLTESSLWYLITP